MGCYCLLFVVCIVLSASLVAIAVIDFVCYLSDTSVLFLYGCFGYVLLCLFFIMVVPWV